MFEPRYREMIGYCEENNTLLGICHTQKVLHSSKPNQSTEDILQSNQATYKPFEVFSAGSCEDIERLDDGRLLLNVNLLARYRMVEEVQTLPFMIYKCSPVEDDVSAASEAQEVHQLQQKILTRLIALTNQNQEIVNLLRSDEWQSMDGQMFSFRLFGLLKLGAGLQQKVLEMRSPVERLSHALALINR